jgi:hypothetical protein
LKKKKKQIHREKEKSDKITTEKKVTTNEKQIGLKINKCLHRII